MPELLIGRRLGLKTIEERRWRRSAAVRSEEAVREEMGKPISREKISGWEYEDLVWVGRTRERRRKEGEGERNNKKK
ncbi:hypothetical protein RchiOBHm_Chr2g0117571 [Rosa chinensis]|uniref:Uncharacterized protein n=1 Tax=Rosa chinensis TaxID=74649 RepID=A0A2P6RRI8_ROSCH|nr:hypothetical protein RchiOBHm_Chr2g0117571 [Rosa chinensis]